MERCNLTYEHQHNAKKITVMGKLEILGGPSPARLSTRRYLLREYSSEHPVQMLFFSKIERKG
jgi:hypothetical protein